MESNNNISKSKIKSYHFVYIIHCSLTNEYYFGKHSTDNKDDGYFGSGSELNRRKKELGKEHFKLKRIATFDNEKEAKEHEEDLIRIYISDIKCLNRIIKSVGSKCDHSIYIYPSGKIARLHINDPDVLSGLAVGISKGKPRPDVSKRNKIIKTGLPSLLKGKKRPNISKALTGKQRPDLIEINKARKGTKNINISLSLRAKFTSEETDFILKLKALGFKISEITKAFNEKFSKCIGVKGINNHIKRNENNFSSLS